MAATIPPAAETRFPEPLRAVVTVVLAVYFTGLTLSVAGNSGSGASALVRTIKGRLFSPWLVPAWLDLGFDHRLTHGLPDDADHVLEMVAYGPAGGGPLRFPGAVSGERARRWRRLARALAQPEGADELVAAVGRGAFDDLATDDLTVRVLRHEMHDRSAAAAPGMERAFAARVRLAGGEVQLLRVEPRGEVAPLLKRPGRAEPAGESP
jgi:hypothetical protein